MREKSETIKIHYYLGLVFKHRWLLIIPFCIAMAVGMYLAVKLPKIYEAGTLILIMPQRVPSNFVQSIVSTDIDSRINTISQQILSRTNLKKIMEEFGLFSDAKYSGMFIEDKLADIRERIKVEVNRAGRGKEADAFSISFKGPDPEIVMAVTNRLAGAFIDENLKVREAQAMGTSDFLAEELITKRKRLEEVEQKLREYRRQYMGELPEQLDANLRILERLQLQLGEREQTLRDEKSRLPVIENQIEGNRKILAESRQTETVSAEGDVLSLELLKAQLNTLKSNYTDLHPDVIKLKVKIADLEASHQAGELPSAGESRTGESRVNVSGDPALQLVSNTLNDLMRQRLDMKADIKNIGLDIVKLNRQIGEYQQRVERTPEREQELMKLRRDYENNQESYNSLLNRKLEAEIAVNMEKKQKGEQFRIIDHAALPRKPVSPDMRKLFMLSVAGGLGFGAGLIFLLAFMNSSLKQPKDYESELGLAVLATIPKLLNPKDKILRRINRGLTAVSLIFAAALTAGFGLLVFKGVEPMMEIVRTYIKI
jgi:polysaccharide chain length determinant protein (PEP-CTERM system associated)